MARKHDSRESGNRLEGCRCAADLTHVAIARVDQPRILRGVNERLSEFAGEHATFIGQPEHDGKRGHPVFLPNPHFREIAISVPHHFVSLVILRFSFSILNGPTETRHLAEIFVHAVKRLRDGKTELQHTACGVVAE